MIRLIVKTISNYYNITRLNSDYNLFINAKSLSMILLNINVLCNMKYCFSSPTTNYVIYQMNIYNVSKSEEKNDNTMSLNCHKIFNYRGNTFNKGSYLSRIAGYTCKQQSDNAAMAYFCRSLYHRPMAERNTRSPP